MLNQGSVSAWVKTNTDTCQTVLSKSNTSDVVAETDEWAVKIGNCGGTTLIYVSKTSADSGIYGLSYSTATRTELIDNKWHHIAVTMDGSALKIYLDGVQKTITVNSGSNNGAFGPLNYWDGSLIGVSCSACGGIFTNNLFKGAIDELKIYNYARTAGQIKEDMNAGHPAPGSPVGTSVGWWRFDEGYGLTTGSAHNSGNCGASCNGNITNMVQGASSGWTNSGKFGKALNFDGTNDFVAMPSDLTQFKVTSAVTLSAWVNLTSTAAQRDIICKWTNTAATSAYCLYTNSSGQLVMGISDGASITTTTETTQTLNTGTWYHVIGVYNPSSDVTLYINGIQVKQNTTSIPAALGNPTTIMDIGAENAGTNPMNGSIDEPKVYAQNLTADQVKVDMNQAKAEQLGALSDNSSYQKQAANQEYCVPGDSTSCSSPLARWDFDEGSGTTIQDSSGHNNPLTRAAGATYTNGKFNKSLNFDGGGSSYVSDQGTVASNLSISAPATLEAWVKTSSDTCQTIYYNGYNVEFVDYRPWELMIGNGCTSNLTNELITIDRDSSAVYTLGYTTATRTELIDNKWHHITVTADGSAVQLYLDGVRKTLTVGAGSNNGSFGPVFPATEMFLGITVNSAFQIANPLKGSLDKVMLFNYARTPAQVAWDYNKGGPVAQWKMDECQGTTINDSSGNSFTGTLTNAATPGTCTTSGSWFNGVTGKRNYSISLDGSDDLIQVADNANLRFDSATQDFSLFAWVKRAANGTMNVISKEDADNDGYRLQFTSSDTVRCSVNAIDVDSSATITDTNWHLVGCTIARAGNGQVYIDGMANGTATAISSTAMATTSVIRLGAISYTTGSTLNGQIDDVKIYNYPLTATQVKTLYNDGAYRTGPVTGAP